MNKIILEPPRYRLIWLSDVYDVYTVFGKKNFTPEEGPLPIPFVVKCPWISVSRPSPLPLEVYNMVLRFYTDMNTFLLTIFHSRLLIRPADDHHSRSGSTVVGTEKSRRGERALARSERVVRACVRFFRAKRLYPETAAAEDRKKSVGPAAGDARWFTDNEMTPQR